jgi:hypothetical protein
VGSCEHGYELSGIIKGREFLDHLKYCLLRKSSAPWNLLFMTFHSCRPGFSDIIGTVCTLKANLLLFVLHTHTHTHSRIDRVRDSSDVSSFCLQVVRLSNSAHIKKLRRLLTVYTGVKLCR